jgi:hypothetical protein
MSGNERCARHAAWRRARLAQAGFPPLLAARLARDARVDIHALLELVESGCTPYLAARIAEPLGARGDAA